jgi:hypothetical protein
VEIQIFGEMARINKGSNGTNAGIAVIDSFGHLTYQEEISLAT